MRYGEMDSTWQTHFIFTLIGTKTVSLSRPNLKIPLMQVDDAVIVVSDDRNL